MSWTTPKFEKLGPMPGGKQGQERQGSNEGQSKDADTEGDVELPPLNFENEENSSSDDDKTLVITQVLEVQTPELLLFKIRKAHFYVLFKPFWAENP